MDMLTKKMRRFVNGNGAGYSAEVRKAYYRRLETYVEEALKDLELLARKLPEDNQRFIFTDELLRPFINSLLEGRSGSTSKYPAIKDVRRFRIAVMLSRLGISRASELLDDPLVKDILLAQSEKEKIIRAAEMLMRIDDADA